MKYEHYLPKDGFIEVDLTAYSNPKLIGYNYFYSQSHHIGDIKVKMENKKLIIYGFYRLGKRFNTMHLIL